jgi:hypothetical protein
MGYARNFQPPSFFNPFSGYYGANTGMGGFQSQFGGFQQPQFGGFGGFGGGFQQPQYGGFQQPFGGGFSQPSFGNPFSRGFNPRTMPPQMQPQAQPMPVSNDLSGRDLIGGGMGGFGNNQPRSQPYNPATGRGFGDGGMGGFNPMMGGIGGFGGYGMPNRQPFYGDSRMGRGLRQADNYADMRMPQPQVQDIVPTEYSVIADLARANGISAPMMTLEESTQGTGTYTGRATDYYKQQLGAKNIDFGESALAPYRQKIIENYRNTRMHNA